MFYFHIFIVKFGLNCFIDDPHHKIGGQKKREKRRHRFKLQVFSIVVGLERRMYLCHVFDPVALLALCLVLGLL
jgi:hypothetical protein